MTAVKNMGGVERWASVMTGGFLTYYGLRRRDSAGVALALVGGSVALRGIQGHSELYDSLGLQGFAGAGGEANVVRGLGVRVERSITVQARVDEVFRFWRHFENLPRFMEHLVSVRQTGGNTWHWVAKAPVGHVEWDAEITDEQVPWRIAWRSLPGSQIDNAGSVRFSPAPSGRGTEVKVLMAYKPLAGALGALIARFRGEEPGVQVREDLRRFKQIVEAGEIASAGDDVRGGR